MKWLKLIGGVLLALIAVLALVPFFLEIDDYIPAVERELSARLGQPVSIDDLDASLLPLPHLVADGIAIGSAEEIKVGKVTLKPDLWSFLGSSKTLRSLDFEDLTLTSEALAGLMSLTKRDAGSGELRIEKIRLKSAVIKLEQGKFGPFDAEVVGSGTESPAEFSLETQDGAFKARVKPEGDRYNIEVSAKAWTSPLGPPIRFDELEIKGVANNSGAELHPLSGRLYGGTVDGKVNIGWGKAVTVKGELAVKQVELKDAAALVSPKTRVSGRLDAKPVFSASAAKAAGLDEALRLETPFTVHNGVLQGFDLASAAAALLKQGGGGGQTRFDELAGRLVVEHRAYRFMQLRIASGSIEARGNVTIGANKALSGELNTTIKGTGAGIPLKVAGTLDSPMLYPNTTALIGAAAGTAVLGPGLGTAAGAKLGEFAEKLLGKKP